MLLHLQINCYILKGRIYIKMKCQICQHCQLCVITEKLEWCLGHMTLILSEGYLTVHCQMGEFCVDQWSCWRICESQSRSCKIRHFISPTFPLNGGYLPWNRTRWIHLSYGLDYSHHMQQMVGIYSNFFKN